MRDICGFIFLKLRTKLVRLVRQCIVEGVEHAIDDPRIRVDAHQANTENFTDRRSQSAAYLDFIPARKKIQMRLETKRKLTKDELTGSWLASLEHGNRFQVAVLSR